MALFEKGQAALMCGSTPAGPDPPAQRCRMACGVTTQGLFVGPTPEAAACSGAHTMCRVQPLAPGLTPPSLPTTAPELPTSNIRGVCVCACLRVLVHLQLRGHPDEQGIVPVARRVSHPFELAEVCMCARVRMHVSARARACACACACVCACMHARVRVCVRVCVRVRVSRAPKLAFLSQHLTRRKQTDVPLCICRRGAGPHTRR
jgi:hypothetical protein